MLLFTTATSKCLPARTQKPPSRGNLAKVTPSPKTVSCWSWYHSRPSNGNRTQTGACDRRYSRPVEISSKTSNAKTNTVFGINRWRTAWRRSVSWDFSSRLRCLSRAMAKVWMLWGRRMGGGCWNLHVISALYNLVSILIHYNNNNTTWLELCTVELTWFQRSHRWCTC